MGTFQKEYTRLERKFQQAQKFKELMDISDEELRASSLPNLRERYYSSKEASQGHPFYARIRELEARGGLREFVTHVTREAMYRLDKRVLTEREYDFLMDTDITKVMDGLLEKFRVECNYELEYKELKLIDWLNLESAGK